MSNRANKILTALLTLTLGLCAAVPTVQAQEAQTAEAAALSRISDAGLSSQGNLVYEDGKTGAQIYTADFLLLKNKLDTIPNEVFHPACYTHTHQWEYLNVNERTHTRHCDACGNAFDLVNEHRAVRQESCTFSYGGVEYSGIRYTCVCGYQWEQERAHTLFFETVDGTCHQSRCCLEGTKFCPGGEPIEEEHYAYYYEPCEDGCHHEKVCMDCGYRVEEACCFELPGKDGGSEDGGNGENNSSEGKRCQCGNVEKQDTETDTDTSDDTDQGGNDDSEGEGTSSEEGNGDASSDEGNGDPSSGEGDGDSSSGEGNGDVSPGTEDVETPADTESGENTSGTEAGSENKPAEPGDEPEAEERPDGKDTDVTQEMSRVSVIRLHTKNEKQYNRTGRQRW